MSPEAFEAVYKVNHPDAVYLEHEDPVVSIKVLSSSLNSEIDGTLLVCGI